MDINPASAVARNARYFAESVALTYAGGDLTYEELDDRAGRLSSVLVDGGTGVGDRVAYLGLNSSSFLITMLAAFRVAAIFVPVNFRLAGPELQQVLQRSGATTLVAEEGHRAAVEAIKDKLSIKRLLLVDDDLACPAAAETSGWERWATLLERAKALPTIAPGSYDDPAILMFTSGTTGLPKGVILTYGNVWWNAINVETRLDTHRRDVTHASAPMFHIGALNSFVLRTLMRGGTVVVRRGFDPAGFADDVANLKVNSTFLVPAMLGALARTAGAFERDYSSLNALVVAGAPVPPSLISHFADHGVLLQQAWGLTETAPFATHLPAELTFQKLGSAGIPMPHTEIDVVDPLTLESVPAGTAGEVIVRGPNVTPGYWEDPEATSAAFDAEGWFHSGDIGYLDKDGFLYVVDRLKDMIISGGENVYPAEVERALSDMDGVTDVAIIGAPDDEWGETVVAVVSLAAGAEVTINDVRAHAAARIARYKIPRQLVVVESVPRNASGKLDKLALRGVVGKHDSP
ncbi:AMP-binding protein [Nocardioides sp. LS1]|uniref:AMP-binding protein n=1 Tax=Nocardioides sp. LS1 TaxID=1027620 RepID=UPI001C8BC97A|nr:AMP-binding protein [Nocardioides sp. LS1]